MSWRYLHRERQEKGHGEEKPEGPHATSEDNYALT
jgi:hypothetical protein